MDHVRKALGMSASHPNDEQLRVAERQERVAKRLEKRFELRKQSIDLQNEVLAADRRDARGHR